MSTQEPIPSTVTIHLVRHGEVENPSDVIYGRLPGFHLSERGIEQAREAAAKLAERDIGAIWASPLERARETAALIAAPHGLEVVVEERLLEVGTTLEGIGRNLISFLRAPQHWWSLRNPLRPTWGEPYAKIRERMGAVIADASARSGGREIVLVSHQTPVRETVRLLARRRRPTISGMSTPCHTGSITTLRLEGSELASMDYFKPIA